MGPKKDIDKKDVELYDLVETLSKTVESLKRKIDDSTTDDDIKKLTHTIVSLTDEVKALKEDNLNELHQSINFVKDTLLQNVIESNKKLTVKLDDAEQRILQLEKSVNLNSQRSRENNIEFHGIDDAIDDDELETVVKGICETINVKVKGTDIEGCHRLPAQRNQTYKPTIVKFVNRKKPENLIKNRIQLKDMNLEARYS